MITLITGTPGSGKTLYAVSKILEYVEQNKRLLQEGKEPRMIYANIDGLNIEGVEPAPNDWRDTPDGSIIFYDEIQQLEPYKKSRFDNDICDALQVHRHTGHDIFGITQFPVLLHPNFRAVVGMHQHLHRGWGLSAATVFNWAYCVDAPNAPSNKKLAEHTFRFNYPKQLYKYYKSATQHTHKARLPKRIFIGIVVLFSMAYLSYSLLFTKNNFFAKIYGFGGSEKVKVEDSQNQNKPAVSLSSDTQQNTQIASSVSEVESINFEIQKIEIKMRLEALEQQYKEQQQRLSTPASVVMFGTLCTAYNSDNMPMEMPFIECKKYATGEKQTYIQKNQDIIQ